jgi:hypothetical protein
MSLHYLQTNYTFLIYTLSSEGVIPDKTRHARSDSRRLFIYYHITGNSLQVLRTRGAWP